MRAVANTSQTIGSRSPSYSSSRQPLELVRKQRVLIHSIFRQLYSLLAQSGLHVDIISTVYIYIWKREGECERWQTTHRQLVLEAHPTHHPVSRCSWFEPDLLPSPFRALTHRRFSCGCAAPSYPSEGDLVSFVGA